jgi:hypothetical protein
MRVGGGWNCSWIVYMTDLLLRTLSLGLYRCRNSVEFMFIYLYAANLAA